MPTLPRLVPLVLLAACPAAALAQSAAPPAGPPRQAQVAARPLDREAVGVRRDSVVPGRADRAGAVALPEVLAARVPGLLVRLSSGTVGAGTRLQLRGPVGVLLPDAPLVVVDGIRAFAPQNALAIDVGGQRPSRLDDLDPDEVARVEVLHGAAGAARWGPEGATGVVEVWTRRGETGRKPEWRAYAEAGIRTDPAEYPANFERVGVTPEGQNVVNCGLLFEEEGLCTPFADSLRSFNPLMERSPFREAGRSVVGGSVEGGLPWLAYRASVETERELGVLERNERDRRRVAASARAPLFGGLTLDASALHQAGELDLPFGDNTSLGRLAAGLGGNAVDDPQFHGYDRGLPPEDDFYSNRQEATRTGWALSAEWAALPWLGIVGRWGRDAVDQDERQDVFDGQLLVTADLQRARTTQELLATADFAATPSLRLSSTFGAERSVEDYELHARTFFNGNLTARDVEVDRRVVGAYTRAAAEWRGRARLAASLRRDSPHGAGGALVSWSVAGEWRLDEEPFLAPLAWLDALRVRGAAGRVERNVMAFPIFLNLNGCLPDRCAAELDPERVRETEAGLDATLFGRVDVSLTGYTSRTTELFALVPASGGFQVQNAGTVANRGVEAEVRARVWERGRVRLEVEALGWTNRNRLEEISEGTESVPGEGGFAQQNRRGHPLGSYFVRPLVAWEDRDGDGAIALLGCPGPACEVRVGTELEYAGSPNPTHALALGARVSLGEALGLSARLEHQGGARLYNATRRLRCTVADNCPELYFRGESLREQAEIAASYLGSDEAFVEDADFWKLREVAVTVAAPAGLARRVGAREVALTLSGRNLLTWTPYSGFDPEVNAYAQTAFARADLYTQPVLRAWTTRLDVRF